MPETSAGKGSEEVTPKKKVTIVTGQENGDSEKSPEALVVVAEASKVKINLKTNRVKEEGGNSQEEFRAPAYKVR